MKNLIISILILFTGGVYTSSRAQVAEPNGKTFHIKLTIVEGNPTAGSVWTEDELSFTKGNLNSKFMTKREGFPPCAL
jgi:hypothetical protein